MKKDEIKKTVREGYAKIASESCSCSPGGSSCCRGSESAESFFEGMGYASGDLADAPGSLIAGLACGNPIAHAKPRTGETVLDLGSGPGLDCFIAAKAVGSSGHVIGVDMTPEMIDRARHAASEGRLDNVEFRLGEIENLPAADASVDIVISNCVVNLSPDKARVFSEALRVLRPGGRLVVSDIVLLEPLPEELRESEELLVGCIANASLKKDYLALIRGAGFEEVHVIEEVPHPFQGAPRSPAESVVVRAIKRAS